MRNYFVVLGLISLGIIGGLYLLLGSPEGIRKDKTDTEEVSYDWPFLDGSFDITSLGISKLSGFIDSSPDGRFIVFGGYSEVGDKAFENRIFIADLSTGEIKAIKGSPFTHWTHANWLVTTSVDGIYLYNLITKEEKHIADTGFVFTGAMSPDEKTFVYNTDQGIRAFDIKSQKVRTISTKKYDGAFAWFDDSKKILGYQENSLDDIYEAGKGRVLAIWNIETGEVQTLVDRIDMPSSALRHIEWIVPGVVVRINAGYDDGSYEYIVNLKTNMVTYVGETSAMGRSGVTTSQDLERFALVGALYEENGEEKQVVQYFDAEGTLVYERIFNDSYIRESIVIIDEYRVGYLRKQATYPRQTDIVVYDFKTHTEKTLRSYNTWLHALEISNDKKILLGSEDTRLFLIKM